MNIGDKHFFMTNMQHTGVIYALGRLLTKEKDKESETSILVSNPSMVVDWNGSLALFGFGSFFLFPKTLYKEIFIISCYDPAACY